MEIANINLDEIEEKPLLPADREMTFNVIKAEYRIAKKANEKTGDRNPMIAVEIAPMDPEFAGKDYKIYHNWVLTQKALESSDPVVSMKKCFIVVGYDWHVGGFTTEAVQTLQFVGKLSYQDDRPNFPRLSHVLRGVS
jgi:hypothetical protein